MDFFITALVFLVIFSILVLIHEWGHFFAAKKSGIKVEEFGFGLPPRIWGFKKGETLYSLNWIPFGGFVRLLGEDSSDPKALKDNRSYASKPPRVRILVVTAGVIMNMLLAVVLLTFGFTFGIQPLILTGDEVLENLDNGTIKTEVGIVVEEVDEDGAASRAGMNKDDKILSLDGREILSKEQLDKIIEDGDKYSVVAAVERGGTNLSLNIVPEKGEDLGFGTYEILFLPRVVIMDVKEESSSEKAGLKGGDVILKINNEHVYFVDEYELALRGADELNFQVMRGNSVLSVVVKLPRQDLVVISSVYPETPAEEVGIKQGDVIISVNGQKISSPQEVVENAVKGDGGDVVYEIKRGDRVLKYNISPADGGLIGIGLSVINSYENEELSVYAADFPVSVLKIEDVRYPFWIAPVKAVEESARLGVLTVEMFGGVIRSLVTKFSVPDGVAGPVGIAQLTHVFVQEGILSLLRFMALLSLSLAIINILPFPALDGGRLFFILVEVIIGKRINARFEALVHAIGFILLMVLVLMITYSDILRLF